MFVQLSVFHAAKITMAPNQMAFALLNPRSKAVQTERPHWINPIMHQEKPRWDRLPGKAVTAITPFGRKHFYVPILLSFEPLPLDF
jgi:hypothetical protein